MTTGESSDRWRYVVLVAKFSLDFLTQGLLKAFGLLVPALIRKFDTSYGAMGFILSMELTLYFMASPLVCILTKGINPRLLCLVGSVGSSAAIIAAAFVDSIFWFAVAISVIGLLSSPMNQISHEMLHQYFGKRFGSVNSICLMGALVGGMAFPVITYNLLDAYGLEGALLCIAAIRLNCVPIAATFRSPRAHAGGFEEVPECEEGGVRKPVDISEGASAGEEALSLQSGEEETLEVISQSSEAGQDKEGRTKTKLEIVKNFFWVTLNTRMLLKEKAFSFLFLPCKYILQAVFISWTLFIVSYAVSKGLDKSLEAYLPLAGALGGFINQGVVTIILNYRPHWGAALFIIEMASVALAFFLYQLSTSFVHLFICSLFAGGGMFAALPPTYSVLVFYVDSDNFSGMLSLKFFATGVGVVSSGFMAGSLYDVTGSFDDVFMILGGMSVVSVLLTITLMLVRKRTRSEDH